MPGPLKREQLEALTGYTQPSKQVEWVRKHLGIEPPLRRDGRPSISQEVVDAATLRRQPTTQIMGATPADMADVILLPTAGAPGPKWRRANA